MDEVHEFQVVGDLRISIEMFVGVDADEPLAMKVAAKRALRQAVLLATPAITEALLMRGVDRHTVAVNIEIVEEL